ncbi:MULTISPECIES: TRAP transporter large permease subunit [unclassified Bradyrhizobium]|uniref:TRAP transporter large permease subunit n=1 Tax=Bradyrhizobium TaxID=374 RepID=UPI0029163204|nr:MULTISPECIES: TRAP transporter large permease subunit [unclassified Bradyrhizobium]
MPPSHNAVLYALAPGGTISISALFMAGVFPGPLLGFSLILLCIVIAYREGHPPRPAGPAKDSVVRRPPKIQLAASGIRPSSAR